MVFDSAPPPPDRSLRPSTPGPREPQSLALRTRGALILDEEPGAFLFGAFKNVSVVVWRQQATADALRRLGIAVSYLDKSYPQGRSTIHIVMDGAEPPTPEAEEGFIQLMKGGNIACIGVVFLGNGFWASRLRSNSTSMVLQVAKQFELRQHGSIAELGGWLPIEHARRTGVKLSASELRDVVTAFVQG